MNKQETVTLTWPEVMEKLTKATLPIVLDQRTDKLELIQVHARYFLDCEWDLVKKDFGFKE